MGPKELSREPQRGTGSETSGAGRSTQWGGAQVDAAALDHAPNGIFDELGQADRPTGRGGPNHQHFGSDEHQTYGNEGATKAGYTGAYSRPSNGYVFELTQGDISLLAGDEFDPRTTDTTKPKGKQAVVQNLWALAGTASTDPGKTPGTQDELVYAIYKNIPTDPRFLAQGVGAHRVPIFKQKGNPAAKAVEDRYLQLASVNFEHFAHPGGKGGPKEGENRGSASGSYRALHEDAIALAYKAKASGQPINEAMAHDAAAQHFLQDGFSSGHVRTPRREISEYWDNKYPLLNDQFKKSIAQEMAIYINAHETNVPTIWENVRGIYADVLEQIDAKASAFPPLTMDPLVGLLAHDVDNEHGLEVTNDLGDRWTTYGDGRGGVRIPARMNAPPQGQADTRLHVEKAVMLSVQDIQHAYAAPANLAPAAVLGHVRSATAAPAVASVPKYGAEQVMPVVDPNATNGVQQWKQASLTDLWNKAVRTDVPSVTFGSLITQSFKGAKGEFREKLEMLSGQIDPVKEIIVKGAKVGTLHPQKAFDAGFKQPLFDAPLARLNKIIEFNPAAGQNYLRDDGATFADLDRLDQVGADKASEQSGKRESKSTSNSALRWLSVPQRAQYIKNMLGGLIGSEEERRIYELFITASSATERRAVYKLVEGRDWAGMLKQADSLWLIFQDTKWRGPFISLMNVK
ncbi:MAG: hypothetical protein WKG01_14215 [Kofleriaceae bacterium]